MQYRLALAKGSQNGTTKEEKAQYIKENRLHLIGHKVWWVDKKTGQVKRPA